MPIDTEGLEFINPFKQYYVVIIPEAIVSYRGLSHGAKLVYGRLQRYAGRKGVAYPNIPELADEVGLGERQAKEYIAELVDKKFIHRERVFAKGNVYRFCNHPCLSGTEIGAPRVNSGSFSNGRDTARQSNGQVSAPCNGQVSAPWSTPVSLLPEEGHVYGSVNTPPPQSQNRTQEAAEDLNLDDSIEDFTKNAYSRENRSAKLENLRAKSGLQTCENLRSGESSIGPTEFRLCLLAFLRTSDDFLKQNRWPIAAFLKNPLRYEYKTPVPTPAERLLGYQPPETTDPSVPRIPLRTMGSMPAPPVLPEEADMWNEIVDSGPYVSVFDWGMDEGKHLRRCREHPKFTMDAWRIVCQKVQPVLAAGEGAWITFRWLIKDDNNWWKALNGEYDNAAKVKKSRPKVDPMKNIIEELGL